MMATGSRRRGSNPREWSLAALWLGAAIGLLSQGPVGASATWMYLGIAHLGSATTSTHSCHILPGLVYQQLRVCEENPHTMPCVSYGARVGIEECHHQFKKERWNCTTPEDEATGGINLFGQILKRGTKETAFMYAVTSAGVVHAVTKACSSGNLTDCTCDLSQQGQTSGEGWKWGGCSDNVDYGMWFAETFVDAPEKLRHTASKDIRSLMNLQNNAVGRQVINDQMNLKCRCHGVSGSCAVKTCWRTLTSFREAGNELKQKYENSISIAEKSKRKLRQRQRRQRQRRTSNNGLDMVYIEDSPNYCRKNMKRGILGTKGRECERDPDARDSCNTLCCGRGYNTEVVRFVERCQCKFVWCCEVKCKICETITDKQTCK
ncbi:hypothetical protein CAPTEDRAFT_149951 [Capitella teleta]|uniref:Protein Wnt n=1 Tax=Capitella teleta TaxID=283909 RepID=R7T4H2_CAPTE|nr:hypothetical protein CAPTEDRAFT_149951 [Capitella teleta]|eukprot:ELT87681.1 hypothetical protein CAPTEDRAFT_149951 [Capitella teleta]